MQNVFILNSESEIDQRAGEAELGRTGAWHVTNCKTVNRPRLRTPAAASIRYRTFKTSISTIQQPTATLMLLLLHFDYTILI